MKRKQTRGPLADREEVIALKYVSTEHAFVRTYKGGIVVQFAALPPVWLDANSASALARSLSNVWPRDVAR